MILHTYFEIVFFLIVQMCAYVAVNSKINTPKISMPLKNVETFIKVFMVRMTNWITKIISTNMKLSENIVFKICPVLSVFNTY